MQTGAVCVLRKKPLAETAPARAHRIAERCSTGVRASVWVDFVGFAHAFCRQGIYNGCMSKSITIRNVPDRARNELAARAARQGQSLQEFLRAELMALADRPDNRSLMEAIRTRKREMGTNLVSERVLELRDSDRR